MRRLWMIDWGLSGEKFERLIDALASVCTVGALPIYPWRDTSTTEELEFALRHAMIGTRSVRGWPQCEVLSPCYRLLAVDWVAARRVLAGRGRFSGSQVSNVYRDFFGFDNAGNLVFGTFAEYEWAWISLTPQEKRLLPGNLWLEFRRPTGYETSLEPQQRYPELEELLAVAAAFKAVPDGLAHFSVCRIMPRGT